MKKCSGKTVGEKAMGSLSKPWTPKEYPHKQSKDGNGGK